MQTHDVAGARAHGHARSRVLFDAEMWRRKKGCVRPRQPGRYGHAPQRVLVDKVSVRCARERAPQRVAVEKVSGRAGTRRVT